jgi:DNA-binding Xre family transcriptional regulator
MLPNKSSISVMTSNALMQALKITSSEKIIQLAKAHRVESMVVSSIEEICKILSDSQRDDMRLPQFIWQFGDTDVE